MIKYLINEHGLETLHDLLETRLLKDIKIVNSTRAGGISSLCGEVYYIVIFTSESEFMLNQFKELLKAISEYDNCNDYYEMKNES